MSLYNIFYKILQNFGINQRTSLYLSQVIVLIAFTLIGTTLYLILKVTMQAVCKKLSASGKNKWAGALARSTSMLKALKIILIAIAWHYTYIIPQIQTFVDTFLLILISIMSISFINSILNLINDYYEKHSKQSKSRPIKGLITVTKIILFVVVVILVVAKILNQSPVYILTGLGALSAVTMLIFKDSILGFVAGFQMSANDLVRIGDWIEMPKYGADGDVIDISLSFVKVRNWDKTITTIPAYALVSDSFVNWRGMFESGARRIKRSINIDVSSITFCDSKLFDKLLKVGLINDYLLKKQQEIENYNAQNNIDTTTLINGRRLTNLGIFRIYITNYLKNHPKIHKEFLLIVRQLQNQNTGVPLEIYAFTNDTAWVNYEAIMADIFDHIYAAATYFNLKIFQEPSGSDFSNLAKNS